MHALRYVAVLAFVAALSLFLRESAHASLARAPYFYTPFTEQRSWAWSINPASSVDDCEMYQADLVSGIVEQRAMPAFTAWAHAMGFSLEEQPPIDFDGRSTVFVEVHVPPGTAKAALPLAHARPGVVTMDLSGGGSTDMMPTRCPGLIDGWVCDLDVPQWFVKIGDTFSTSLTTYASTIGLRLLWARGSIDNGPIDQLWFAGTPASDSDTVAAALHTQTGIISVQPLSGADRLLSPSPCPAA